MTSPDLPPLDPEIAELLDAERKRAAPAEARAAVAANLAGALAPKRAPVLRPATRGWTPRRVAQVAVVSFAAGGLAGALGHARFAPPPAPPAPTIIAPPAPPPSPPSAAPVAPPVATSSAPEAPLRAPSAKPAPSARTPDDDLAAEQVLVETGRSALGRGDYASALAALDRHAREFPRGRLAEERDVLRVQALALAGRTDEARTRAEAFRARYPKSVFLPLLEEALRGQ